MGGRGYKISMCSWFMLEDLFCPHPSHKCWDAHGKMDLRRAILTVPPELQFTEFVFCDAHVHLDQVLLARRYGSGWVYKRSLCTHQPCTHKNCLWAHDPSERRRRLPFSKEDLLDLADDFKSLSGGTFGGCVHSSCEPEAIKEATDLVQWAKKCYKV